MNENTSVGISESLNITGNSKNFIVKTKSVFSNVYLITAPSREKAIQYVEDSGNAPDFIQKHEDETVVYIEECNDPNIKLIDLKTRFTDFF